MDMRTSILCHTGNSRMNSDFWVTTVKVRVNGRVLGVYEREHCKAFATKGEAQTTFLLFLQGEIQSIFEGAIENDC